MGALRWKEPQPLQKWTGVRKTVQFGPRCAQRPVFGDMNFRSNGIGEDCLYLNIWTPGTNAHNAVSNWEGGPNVKLPGLSVYLTGFTPFDHTLEFEAV